ncbi:MAG: histidine kinase, partial [Prevotella sp.]|nr:histidine kinase [Prevotella sp.]
MKPNMQSYFLNNYGNYFYFKKDYPAALKTFRRLKAHIERHHAENNFDMYLCKINMADVFLNLGQTDSARIYVGEAERFFEEQHVGIGVFYAHTIRIGIAVKEKKYGEVREILKEEESMPKVDAQEIQEIRNRYMNQYYAAIGDYRRAYLVLQGNINKKDSAETGRQSMRSQDIMLQLAEDTIRLHHQLAMNEQKPAHAKTQLAMLIFAASFIILGLAFALWLNYTRKQRLKTNLNILSLRLLNARQRISPHFVFNVLNSRISNSNKTEADQLLMLAKLIRTNLDLTTKTYITLADELEFVKEYVEVERTLMGETIDFSMDVPAIETMGGVKIPSMMIQILVENAIIHGLKGRDGDKRLNIKVVIDEEKTTITVSDNGPGFDIRKYNSERTRTGLNIIRTTVAAINQENNIKAKMVFGIRNDNGCHATLTIPKNIKLL